MPDSITPEIQAPSLEGSVSDAEWEARVNLAAAFRVAYHYGWNDGVNNHISARVPDAPDQMVMNPQGLGWHEMTASCLIKSDFEGNDLSESELNLAPAGRNFHAAILRLRPELSCTIHIHPAAGVAVSATKDGLYYYDQTSAMLYGRVSYHHFEGLAQEADEGERIVADLDDNMMLIMWNHGLLTVGRTVGEAINLMHGLVGVCDTQVQLMSMGAEIRHLPKELCEHTQAQIAERQKDSNKPGGELFWKMCRRLADKLDPSYRN